MSGHLPTERQQVGASRREEIMFTRYRLSRFWRNLVHRDQVERDLDDELQATFALLVDEKLRSGMSLDNARRGATLDLGGIESVKCHVRDAWAGVRVETLLQDFRYAWRVLRRVPGFAAVVVVTLALGIGANTALFSLADALLLRPLPVVRPGEVLTVGSWTSFEALSATSLVSSYRDYVDMAERTRTFEGLVAFTHLSAGFATDPKAVPKLTMGMLVSGNFFSLMGVKPAVGRSFRPEEHQVPGRDAVVVLGH